MNRGTVVKIKSDLPSWCNRFFLECGTMIKPLSRDELYICRGDIVHHGANSTYGIHRIYLEGITNRSVSIFRGYPNCECGYPIDLFDVILESGETLNEEL